MPNRNIDRFLGPASAINTRQVPPGPVAAPEPVQPRAPLAAPGQAPVPTPQGPQVGPALGAPGPALVPAPNSQGALTPEQVQIVGAVVSDPLMLETVINLAAQQMQAQAPAPTPGPGPGPGLEAALFGGG